METEKDYAREAKFCYLIEGEMGTEWEFSTETKNTDRKSYLYIISALNAS